MCDNCYERKRIQAAKLDNSKHRICIECNKNTLIKGRGMCHTCYQRTTKLDDSKKKICVECNQSRLIRGREMCDNCYQRIFILPKRKAKRLAAKNDPLRNHKPKLIPKIEMPSESADDLTQPRDVSSDDEGIASKIGIKMEIKCEP